MLAVEFVRYRRSHASAQTGLDVQEFLALIGAVSHEVAVGNNLENKISGCRDRAAADATAAGRDPLLRLRDRIPGDQRAPLTLGRFRPDGGRSRQRFVRRRSRWPEDFGFHVLPRA